MQFSLNINEDALLFILLGFSFIKALPGASKTIRKIRKKRLEKEEIKKYEESMQEELFSDELKKSFSDLTEDEQAILNRSKLMMQELKDIEEINRYERMFYSSKEDDSIEELTQEEIEKFSKNDEVTK